MFRRRFFSMLTLAVLTVLVLAACAPAAKPVAPGAAQPNSGPKSPATGGEYVYHVPSDPDSFAYYWAQSAYATTVTDKVFGDGLLTINPRTLQPEPWLAEALPTVGADQKTYVFNVRKGVKFHDGKELTAHDIVFAYEILMHPDYKGRSKSVVSEVESVKALSDYSIEFKTKEVFAPFIFTVPYEAPIPKSHLKDVPIKDMANHDFWKQPIGAGPWKFVEWKAGQHTLLARFDDYWAKGREGGILAADKSKKGTIGPYFDTVRIRVIPETNTAVAALEAGELTSFGSMEPGQVDRIKQEKASQLAGHDWDRMGYGYQTFNMESFPTNIAQVRQALSYGLNRPAIIEGVMEKKATLPAGFVPPIHWVFNQSLKPYNYDKAKAMQLIEQAGFEKNARGMYEKDGQPLKVVYYGTKGSPIVEGIALASQKDWQAIGVEVDLQLVDFNTLLKAMREGTFNVVFSGLGFSVDPYLSFNNFSSKNILKDDKGLVQGGNSSRFSDPRVDELVDNAMKVVDLKERKQLYQQAESIIMAAAPVNPIYVNLWTDFIKKDVKGVSVANGYGLVYMDQWYASEK